MLGPVLQRELIEFLRSRRAFVILGVYLAALAAVLILSWPSGGRLELRAPIARAIYDIFARGQFALLLILTPVLATPSIAGERERRTADLLFTSPLSSFTIAGGKALSALIYLLLLAISSLPFFSCCLFLGGVGEREIAATFIFLFLAVIFAASLGLLASAHLHRSRSALALCYAVLVPPALVFIFANPFRSLVAAVLLGIPTAASAAAMFLFACRKLRRAPELSLSRGGEEKTQDAPGLILSRRRFPDRLLLPAPSNEQFTAGARALLEKEIRYDGLGRDTLVMRILLQLTMLTSAPFFIAAIWCAALWIYTFYLLAVIMVIMPPLAAGAFTEEREGGTLDLLLTTPLTKAEVLIGKLVANLRHFSAIMALPMPFLLLFWLIMAGGAIAYSPADIFGWFKMTAGTLLVLAGAAALALLIALVSSLVCRTTLRSMVASYLSLVIIYLAPLVAYLALTRLADFDRQAVMWAGIFSPFFAASALEADGAAAFLPPSAIGPRVLLYHLFFMAISCTTLLGCLFQGYDRYCRFRREYD